jgi:hypothetical protein
MHIVEPSGKTKPAIRGGMPNSVSATAMAVGNVADELLVENAVINTVRIRLKNTTGEIPTRNRRTNPNTTTTCVARAPNPTST